MRWFCSVLIASGLLFADWPRHVIADNFRTNTACAADFTGDGKVDVIANEGPSRRDVLFVAPDWKRIEIGRTANSIHSLALDVDGDGDLDYVAAQHSPGLLYWLEQPENPTHAPWKMHILDSAVKGGLDGIHGLAAADINGDGKPDLVANSALPEGAFPNSAAWFAAPNWTRHIFADGDAPGLSHYFGTGDLNRDGRTDIALAAKVPPGGNWFAWWEQPPDATRPWIKHLIAADEEGASNVLVADVNGDGHPDLLASRGHGSGVLWFAGPSWKPHNIDAAIPYPHSLAAGDLDGDGDLDTVACSAVYDKKPKHPVLVWYENDGNGEFRRHPISNSQASYHLTLVDMDGDRDLDILIAGQESRNVVWYENKTANQSAPSAR